MSRLSCLLLAALLVLGSAWATDGAWGQSEDIERYDLGGETREIPDPPEPPDPSEPAERGERDAVSSSGDPQYVPPQYGDSSGAPDGQDGDQVRGQPLVASGRTYTKAEIITEMQSWFAESSATVTQVVDRAFADHGEPTAYIKGTEGGGAFLIGLRYGEGTLNMKEGVRRQVHWQGPSLGLDIGGNASKVFVMIFGLQDPDFIYRRFPGAGGGAYVVGGLGVNVLKGDGLVLSVVRSGVGLRLGANLGYVHFTRDKSYNPF